MGMLICLSLALFAVAFAAPDMKLGKSMFDQFKLKHGRSYTSQVEEELRFDIFMNSLQRVQKLNAQKGATFGVTRFSDWTLQEKQRFLMSKKPVSERPLFTKRQAPISRAVPESFDWRDQGIVPAVRDQADCGSCWAFATIGVVESMKAIQTGAKLDLSEQQIVDCDTESEGCDGGWYSSALELVKAKGVVAEVNYPYKALTGSCKAKGAIVHEKISEVIYLPVQDANAVAQHVAEVGPAAVYFGVPESFFDYVSGVWEPSLDDCDWGVVGYHAVLAVGYGVENGKQFWIIKNSWGPSWGDAGFFKMIKGVNRCEIETEVIGAK